MNLGRLVQHDPRSRNYAAVRAAEPRSVLWRHKAPVLDQFYLGSCTAHALANCLNTTYFAASRPQRRYLNHNNALDLYRSATRLDEFPGQWEPDDTGSSSIGVCKAGIRSKYLTAYRHTFNFTDALRALALSPAITGVNWYERMLDVDTDGFIRVSGDIVGGHEVALLGVNIRNRYLVILNSWSASWGQNGRARITFADFERLLDEQGDVTVPVGVR